MRSMVRFSEAANLAIHSLVWMVRESAREEGRAFSAAEIGASLGVSPSHLAKVLQGLVRRGWLTSVRGTKGGFRLEMDPERTSFLELLEVVDGPMAEVGGCLLGNPICRPGECRLAPLHAQVRALVEAELGKITFSGFVRDLEATHGRDLDGSR